jgi:penicillin amidase
MLLRFAVLGYLFFLSTAHASPCELYRDALRIPHLKISDEKNFSYCFGYMHGRDRAWMMDYFRRSALGTNAEVYGFSHLKGDMMMRLLDLPRMAERLWSNLLPQEKELLEIYASGVNQGFRFAKQTPTKEFQDNYPHPEDWKPQHTLMVLLLQSFDQTRKSFYTEWLESQTQKKWGVRAQDLVDSDAAPWETTILKEGEYLVGAQSAQKNTSNVLPEFFAQIPSIFGDQAGSNNWVVNAKRTKNKMSMLANDPHLDLKTPMFWYWIHLEGPSVDVIGASLPGVPLIVSGTNRKISWGLTNSYLNSADAVFVNKDAESKLERFWPVVWVKWGILKLPIFFKSFQRTQEGYPVLPLESDDLRPILLKWSGYHIQGEDIAALRDIMKVRSVSEMDRVVAKVGIPSWNFVFADTFGEIGYRTNGRAFRTPHKHAPGLRAGNLEEISNPEFLSPQEMPHSLKPARGWVVTANNRHWPSNAQLYGGRAYSLSSRAQLIEKLIQETKLHDVESFRRIQCDDQATEAPYFRNAIVQVLSQATLSEVQNSWLEEFKLWDFSTRTDCRPCGIYRRLMDLLLESEQVGESGLWKLFQENSPEFKAEVVKHLATAVADVNTRTWGELHLNPFAHLSGKTDWNYSPELATRGDKHSINPGSARWNSERKVYEHYSGASQRLIVEMKPVPEVWLALPGLNNQYGQYESSEPWKKWERCEIDRVEWPVDWKMKATEKITISL